MNGRFTSQGLCDDVFKQYLFLSFDSRLGEYEMTQRQEGRVYFSKLSDRNEWPSDVSSYYCPKFIQPIVFWILEKLGWKLLKPPKPEGGKGGGGVSREL